MKNFKIIFSAVIILLVSCNKSDFLDKKPSSNIVAPTTITDFQALLDNTAVMNYTGGLPQLASDDYETTYANWQIYSSTQRNSYIWAKDIYGSDVTISDWNGLYAEVFYANVVLDGLEKSGQASTADGQYTKGWALFTRAFALYDLTRNFSKAYDATTANTDLGIPIRLTPGVDYTVQRSTLQQCFDQIIQDLTTAADLLPSARPTSNLNRPSKIAAYAILARIYLDMRNYTLAENYADKSLALYTTLIDYNTISKSSTTPFTKINDELIINKAQNGNYDLTINSTSSPSTIPASIISLYNPNDLRLAIFFSKNATSGNYTKKRGYYGAGLYPFTGLATDELYLIKAECLARRAKIADAMDFLNQLLIKRFSKGTFVPVTAATTQDALTTILLERRKELIWRGLRWQDLKRLNKEGANITLSRVLNGVTYTLLPNDPRYVFPIPNDEIALSHIQQNIR